MYDYYDDGMMRGRDRMRGGYGPRYHRDEDEYEFGGKFWMDGFEEDDEYYDEMDGMRPMHRDGRYMRQGVKGTGPYGIGGRLHYPKRGRYRREGDYRPFDSAPSYEGGGMTLKELDTDIDMMLQNEIKDKQNIFKMWSMHMKNADGTSGPHFSQEQIKKIYTDEKIKEKGIDEMEFGIVLNMFYSDYCKVLKDNGVNSQKMYTDLAVAFINDEDAQKHKTLRYALFVSGVNPDKKDG